MAGNMGVEEEIIDADYPTFLVHSDTWEKMKKSYYENPGEQRKTLGMTEVQNHMTIHEGIEIPDPEQPEEMMSLSIDTRMKIQDVVEKVDQLDIKEDENLYMKLMETSDQTVQEIIPKEEIEDMMYEEDRYWNMEELTEWNDEYIITIGEENHMQQVCDEEEAGVMMLTNLECESLKRFLVQEAAE